MKQTLAALVAALLALAGVTFGTQSASALAFPTSQAVIDNQASYPFTGWAVPRGANELVAYGADGGTGTNQWGAEIAVVDCEVVAKEVYVGDMTVPQGGYVVSGHGNAREWLTDHAQVGDRLTGMPGTDCSHVKASGTGSSLHVDAWDEDRDANELIVYSAGSSTGTNQWGTEVAVDADCVVTGKHVYAGDTAIPSGGFVLSGHGTAREWLTDHVDVNDTITQLGGTDCYGGTRPAPEPEPDPTGEFTAGILGMNGLTHYYPLTSEYGAADVKGDNHGNTDGATFGPAGATFDGNDSITLPDHDDYSVTTTGRLSVTAFLTVDDWRGAGGNGSYIHWMGKGVSGAHEWVFRHYNATSSRPKRISCYHFSPDGGLGSGSYFQDDVAAGTEVMVTCNWDWAGQQDMAIYRDGAHRDTDLFSWADVTPQNTSAPVRIGTRDGSSGYLEGTVRRVMFFDRELTSAELSTIWANRSQDD